MPKLLDIQGLRVHFDTLDGPVEALHSVSLSVNEGEIMGVVGNGSRSVLFTFGAPSFYFDGFAR